MREYPFRYIGPSINQTVWFVLCQKGNPQVFEGKIVEIADYAEIARSHGHYKDPVENYLVDYWVESPDYSFGHGVTFGNEIYETREEAERVAADWKIEINLVLDLSQRLIGEPKLTGQDQLDMAKILGKAPLNAEFDGYDPETGWIKWSTQAYRDWDQNQREYFEKHHDLPDEYPPENSSGEHPCYLSNFDAIRSYLPMGGWTLAQPTESYFEVELTSTFSATPYRGTSTQSPALALCRAILAYEIAQIN